MRRVDVVDDGEVRQYWVERKGVGRIKTTHGSFWEYIFEIDDKWRLYNVIVKAEIDENFMPIFRNKERLVLRIDSGCGTGQLFGDLTCECREQLDKAIQTLEGVGEGIIVHIPLQDGRGMSLGFKLSTLTLQEELHLNTVESARMLARGPTIDTRTYVGVIAILKFFAIPIACEVSLISNNPKKALVFAENGYSVSDMVPIVIPPTQHTRRHLAAKQLYLGHKDLVLGLGEVNEDCH